MQVTLQIIESAAETNSSEGVSDFSLLLLISHYYATRAATAPHPQLAEISTKLLVSMLRHSDIVPADKGRVIAMSRIVEQSCVDEN